MTRVWSIVLVSAGSVVASAAVATTGFFMGRRSVIKGIEQGKIRVLAGSDNKVELRKNEAQNSDRAVS